MSSYSDASFADLYDRAYQEMTPIRQALERRLIAVLEAELRRDYLRSYSLPSWCWLRWRLLNPDQKALLQRNERHPGHW